MFAATYTSAEVEAPSGSHETFCEVCVLAGRSSESPSLFKETAKVHAVGYRPCNACGGQ